MPKSILYEFFIYGSRLRNGVGQFLSIFNAGFFCDFKIYLRINGRAICEAIWLDGELKLFSTNAFIRSRLRN